MSGRPSLRHEVFSLPEGEFTIVFPERLSAESLRDLEEHMSLFMRRLARFAPKDAEPTDAGHSALAQTRTEEERDGR